MRLDKITLFGLATNGSKKEWSVEVLEGSSTFTVYHGKLGGKLQAKHTVCKAKNVGRTNATSANEQAIKEAMAKVTKQRDKGYVDTLEKLSEAPQVLNPMLAYDYHKQGHRIEWNHPLGVHAQPKLDGVRCEVYKDETGTIVYKSRGGKFYPAPKHISEDLEKVFEMYPTIHLDGELYIHGMLLQDIVSAVKKPNHNTHLISFCCFDIAGTDLTWVERDKELVVFGEEFTTKNLNFIHGVPILDEITLWDLHDQYVAQGYEGVMIRQGHSVYKYNYRSPWLQKLKKMQDAEFKIVGHKVDKDGCIVWRIEVQQDLFCDVTPKMTKAERKALVNVAHQYYNKYLKVQYQDRTKDGNLSFPVGLELNRTDHV